MTVEDHEWCLIAGDDGAYCFHSLSENERDLTYEEWFDVSRGWLSCSPEAYGNLKEVVERLCKKTAQCTYEDEQKLKTFFAKVEEAQEKCQTCKVRISIKARPETMHLSQEGW